MCHQSGEGNVGEVDKVTDLFAKISICVMKNHLEQKVHTAWINMTQMGSSDIGHTVRYFLPSQCLKCYLNSRPPKFGIMK